MIDKRIVHTLRSMTEGITDKCAEILDLDEADNEEDLTLFEDIKEEFREINTLIGEQGEQDTDNLHIRVLR